MFRSIRLPARSIGILLVALATVACGDRATGDVVPPTPTDPSSTGTSTTTSPPPSPHGTGDGDIRDLPAACVDALVDLLKDMEPILQGVSVENVFTDEYFEGEDELFAVGEKHEQRIEAACPETDSGPPYPLLIQLAKSHAPGTVPYLEAMATLAELNAGAAEERDCDEVIAAAEELLDPSVAFEDMSGADQVQAALLITSLMANCPADVAADFLSRYDN